PCVAVSVFFFFFFQAEDGIRDWSVTGVQTCALPILGVPGEAACPVPPLALPAERADAAAIMDTPAVRLFLDRGSAARAGAGLARSEERRVGKECRAGGSPDHEKRKKSARAQR